MRHADVPIVISIEESEGIHCDIPRCVENSAPNICTVISSYTQLAEAGGGSGGIGALGGEGPEPPLGA